MPDSTDRDNVPPAFLREVRALVLNATCSILTKQDAAESWVREAAGDPRASDKAINNVMRKRFGEKCVAYDLSDPEANSLAVASGYAVVHGGALSASEWENARRAGALPPAGRVTPSPKPFSRDGKPLCVLHPVDYSPTIARAVNYAAKVAGRFLGVQVDIVVTDDPEWEFNATYARDARVLHLNAASCAIDWSSRQAVNRLLIHEFAHHAESNHLSREFAEAGFCLAAEMVEVALAEPDFFDWDKDPFTDR